MASSPSSEALSVLLGAFLLGEPDVAVWPVQLEAEELLLELSPDGAQVRSVAFSADGVRQLAPARLFDSARCAHSLKRAVESIPTT